MKTPKISIIIPAYNVEEYIHTCINSVLSQTFTDFECILINDGSSDASGEICNEYARKDKRIKVIHKSKNEGVPEARKNGLQISAGEYIQFIDSDDWIEKNMLEKVYAKAVAENLDILIYGCFYQKDNVRKVIQQDFSSYNKINVIKNIIKGTMKAYTWNKFVKKELMLMVKFPYENRSEDYFITIQNIHNSNRIGYISEPLYQYRFNPYSLSNNTERKVIGCIEEKKNWDNIIGFLKAQYKDLKIFEPELSTRINKLKIRYFQDKNTRKIKELFLIYPESKFHHYLFCYYLRKVVKLIIPYGFFIFYKKSRAKREQCNEIKN